MAERICSIEGCSKPVFGRGWCSLHYQRWRAHGDPLSTALIRDDDLARVAQYVDLTDPGGCWPWGASRSDKGYGQVSYGGRNRSAHSVLWRLTVGPIPEGLELDHLCRNRACVNPDHLEPVTHEENMRRGAWASRTHCANGHAFDEANTRIASSGQRVCRACEKARSRRRRAVAR